MAHCRKFEQMTERLRELGPLARIFLVLHLHRPVRLQQKANNLAARSQQAFLQASGRVDQSFYLSHDQTFKKSIHR